MQRNLWRMSALLIGVMLVYAGVVWADRDAPDERGARAPEQQETGDAREGYGPMMYHMQGMMQHMRGMMHGMEGMKGSYGRMHEDADDDDDDDMPRGAMMGHGKMGSMHGMMGSYGKGHGRYMWRHLERLTEDLDLSEPQEQKIRDLVRAHMKQTIQMRAELATQRVDLQGYLDAEKVDMAKVKALLQQMASRRADLRFSGLNLLQEIKQQLTPEQLKTFNARRGHMMWGDGHKGRGDWREHGHRQGYGREMGPGRGMGRGGMGPGMGSGMGPGSMRNPCGTRQAPAKDR